MILIAAMGVVWSRGFVQEKTLLFVERRTSRGKHKGKGSICA